ncbi:UPF0173 metal-dependent hydrolase [Colletotrichum sp. SAR 10_99]|nr:UPF0173 metal-dependent hydrolase [Colletotrichum sp. SAR 10_96]KAJ5015584.1 UPF0173 metal-dependent hydrolase [Colletotrichum sp. SAR 10_99]
MAFPANPVYASKDFVNWRLASNAVNRVSQFPVIRSGTQGNGGGMFANTLRYHNGTFYLISTWASAELGGPRFVMFITTDPVDIQLGFGKSSGDEMGISNFGTPDQHADLGIVYLEDVSESAGKLKPYLRVRARSVNAFTAPEPTTTPVPEGWLGDAIRLQISPRNESHYEFSASSVGQNGATTFRLKANGLMIFLDTWLEKPSVLPKYLDIDDVAEADYIFISHAHFDHLPGADRIAKKTGAIVIANGEAINLLRSAGVQESQLFPVAGGERVPMFTKADRDAAVAGKIPLANGPPGAPARPHHSRAVMSVHVWPSLHALMPGSGHHDIPDEIDTGTEYTGEATPYVCTLDVTMGMKYALMRLKEIIPPDQMDEGTRKSTGVYTMKVQLSHFE